MTENKSKIHKVNSSELWNYLVKNMQIDFSNQNYSLDHLYSYTFVSEKKYKVHALRVFLVKKKQTIFSFIMQIKKSIFIQVN